MSFQRERRYDVTKLSTGKKVDCVVVEKDWPEYEPTWDAIQRRMEGRPSIEEELDDARKIIKKISDYCGEPITLAISVHSVGEIVVERVKQDIRAILEEKE